MTKDLPPSSKPNGVRREPKAPRVDVERYIRKLQGKHHVSMTMRGRVNRITGNVVRARLPNARIGELCSIEPPGRPPVKAQVVGFDDEDVFLTPLDPLD